MNQFFTSAENSKYLGIIEQCEVKRLERKIGEALLVLEDAIQMMPFNVIALLERISLYVAAQFFRNAVNDIRCLREVLRQHPEKQPHYANYKKDRELYDLQCEQIDQLLTAMLFWCDNEWESAEKLLRVTSETASMFKLNRNFFADTTNAKKQANYDDFYLFLALLKAVETSSMLKHFPLAQKSTEEALQIYNEETPFFNRAALSRLYYRLGSSQWAQSDSLTTVGFPIHLYEKAKELCPTHLSAIYSTIYPSYSSPPRSFVDADNMVNQMKKINPVDSYTLYQEAIVMFDKNLQNDVDVQYCINLLNKLAMYYPADTHGYIKRAHLRFILVVKRCNTTEATSDLFRSMLEEAERIDITDYIIHARKFSKGKDCLGIVVFERIFNEALKQLKERLKEFIDNPQGNRSLVFQLSEPIRTFQMNLARNNLDSYLTFEERVLRPNYNIPTMNFRSRLNEALQRSHYADLLIVNYTSE